MVQFKPIAIALLSAAGASAHIAPFAKGMYCRNGLSNADAPNTYYIVEPMVGLRYNDWFMHGKCKNFPPPDGEYLDLPAGGTFTVEMGADRAFTTFSYNGTKTSEWPDGEDHPEGYGDKHIDPRFPLNEAGCISSPNMHCKNEDDAAGTGFAIAYKDDINAVSIDDLVVFSIAAKTPYKRIATYHVPKYLPECPPKGCICAWGWVPNHCGEANEYMVPFRCRVTNVSPNARRLGTPKNPEWCEGEPANCVKGPKKMSYGYQLERNTVNPVRDVPQFDGQWRSWGYNTKLGWAPGAQEDIYEEGSPNNDQDKPTTTDKQDTNPKTTDTPAVKPPSTGDAAAGPTPSSSPKRCRSHRNASSLVKKSHAARRRRSVSFLDHFKL